MRTEIRALGWLVIVALLAGCRAPSGSALPAGTGDGPAPPGAIRFSGTLEAVRSRTISAPRLAGSYASMIITTLAKPGTRVQAGDLLLEFDPQEQQRMALDRRAELVDLDSQIERKHADQAAEEQKDRTGLVAAENDIARAKLAVSTNDLIAQVEAEKNTLTLQQSVAKLEQLQTTFQLRREAAAADLRILEIRRERAERALRYAEQNAATMQVRAPFPGLVVVKTTYRPGSQGMVEILEGDDARPGLPILDIVDTSVMQVRARINQADAEVVKPGMPATIRLDGFPDLSFRGRVEDIMPLAATGLSATVRSFVAIVSIERSHPQLLPDLTASVEVMPASDVRPAAAARGGR
jgi:multidrug resistance efflux pump